MTSDLNTFLAVHIPGRGYHAFDGEIELYSKKSLAFECGCGETHPVAEALAIIDFPVENKAVYLCPQNENIFTLVKATGVFSVKGLKTVASHVSGSESEREEILATLESRKRRG